MHQEHLIGVQKMVAIRNITLVSPSPQKDSGETSLELS